MKIILCEFYTYNLISIKNLDMLRINKKNYSKK